MAPQSLRPGPKPPASQEEMGEQNVGSYDFRAVWQSLVLTRTVFRKAGMQSARGVHSSDVPPRPQGRAPEVLCQRTLCWLNSCINVTEKGDKHKVQREFGACRVT